MNTVTNSDVCAKQEYKERLEQQGYTDVHVVNTPCDILATLNGVQYYFEIKSTAKQSNYFGSASIREWEAAKQNPETYFFVVCIKVNDEWIFTEYTPDEFMTFSTIPPARTYFRIPTTLCKTTTDIKESTTAVMLTNARIQELTDLDTKYRST